MTPIRACLSCGTCNTRYLCFKCTVHTIMVLIALTGAIFLAALSGCGSVTPTTQDLGASVEDATGPGSDGAQMLDASDSADVPTNKQDGGTDASDTHAPFLDAGALPICPEAITHPDCPQPKCDCQDR